MMCTYMNIHPCMYNIPDIIKFIHYFVSEVHVLRMYYTILHLSTMLYNIHVQM